MPKILDRNPITTGEKLFMCRGCRTRYSGDETEYSFRIEDKVIGSKSKIFGNNTLIYQPTWIFIMDCPVCGLNGSQNEVLISTGESSYEMDEFHC